MKGDSSAGRTCDSFGQTNGQAGWRFEEAGWRFEEACWRFEDGQIATRPWSLQHGHCNIAIATRPLQHGHCNTAIATRLLRHSDWAIRISHAAICISGVMQPASAAGPDAAHVYQRCDAGCRPSSTPAAGPLCCRPVMRVPCARARTRLTSPARR